MGFEFRSIFKDSFRSLLTGLGVPGRDRVTSLGPSPDTITYSLRDLENLYRGNWIAKKIVDIPAFDCTRSWRTWDGDQDQVAKMEDAETSFGLQRKLLDAMIKSRLYGGAAMLMGIKGQKFNEELELDKVGQGDLKFIHVVEKWMIQAGPRVRDITSPWFGEPSYYMRSNVPIITAPGGVTPLESSSLGYSPGDTIFIHPSRVVRMVGIEYPDMEHSPDAWGDSVLASIYEAIRDAGLVTQSLANMIADAKVDVFKIPGLTSTLSTQAGTDKMISYFANANVAKSVVNSLVIDKEIDWERIQTKFEGLPEVLQAYLLICSAGADIPSTRMLSREPSGQNATGESDTRNYYDRLSSEQAVILTPTLSRLDEVLIRHTLGDRPKELKYDWNPLWQMTDTEKAAIALQKAQAYKIDVDTALIPAEALVIGRQNQLIEDGVYPGLETALDDLEDNWNEEAQFLPLQAMENANEQGEASRGSAEKIAKNAPAPVIAPAAPAAGPKGPTSAAKPGDHLFRDARSRLRFLRATMNDYDDYDDAWSEEARAAAREARQKGNKKDPDKLVKYLENFHARQMAKYKLGTDEYNKAKEQFESVAAGTHPALHDQQSLGFMVGGQPAGRKRSKRPFVLSQDPDPDINSGPNAGLPSKEHGNDPFEEGVVQDYDPDEGRDEHGRWGSGGITSTLHFQYWFKGSKVVDKDGKPIVAFHGSSKDFSQFNTEQNRTVRNPNWLGGLGSWFAAPSLSSNNYDEGNAEYMAESFAETKNLGAYGTSVYPVYLSIKNPYDGSDHETLVDEVSEAGGQKSFREGLIKKGYDGIVLRNSHTDGDVTRDDWIAFHPTQVKSAIGNKGSFDPGSPDIRDAYDPDEERDYHGRFGSGGGGSKPDLEFYHGTSASLIHSIKTHGLVPSGSQEKEIGEKAKGGDAWAKTQGMDVHKFTVGDRAMSVYITTNPSTAIQFAQTAAEMNSADPIVLKIKIPAARVQDIFIDEFAPNMEAYRFKGHITPNMIASVHTMSGVSLPLSAVDAVHGDVVLYGVILVKPPVADADWEENLHPRGGDHNAGQFSAAGGWSNKIASRETQADAIVKAVDYLRSTSQISKKSSFLLRNGTGYTANAKTYEGKRAPIGLCYMNATKDALYRPDRTYVEGLITVHGVPIEHAWTVDSKGQIYDSTIRPDEKVTGYYGVPFTNAYLKNAMQKNKVYGLLGQESRKTIGPLLSGAARNFKQNADPTKLDDDVIADRLSFADRVLNSIPVTDGLHSADRIELRDKIVDTLYNRDIDKRTHNRTATIVLGLPGSGKSTLSGPLVKEGRLEIEGDNAKAMLPEFAGGVGAYAVHEESSSIMRRVLAKAMAAGDDIIWPRIDSADKIVKDIQSLHDAGYQVNVKFADVPAPVAINSAITRFLKMGRYVSPAAIAGYGDAPRDSYNAAIGTGLLNSYERYKRGSGKGFVEVK